MKKLLLSLVLCAGVTSLSSWTEMDAGAVVEVGYSYWVYNECDEGIVIYPKVNFLDQNDWVIWYHTTQPGILYATSTHQVRGTVVVDRDVYDRIINVNTEVRWRDLSDAEKDSIE